MTESSPEQLRAEQIVELGELTMRSSRDGDVHTLALTGEMDLASADLVEGELLRVEATGTRTILLDLSGLTFLDSTGIRLLVLAEARSREDGNRLRLQRPPAEVQRVLRIAGVESMLPFTD